MRPAVADVGRVAHVSTDAMRRDLAGVRVDGYEDDGVLRRRHRPRRTGPTELVTHPADVHGLPSRRGQMALIVLVLGVVV